MATKLTTYPTMVDVPFVYVTIGEYTFGQVNRSGNHITFPNFIDKLTVTKINGDVNSYELSMKYQITKGDDPNMLEKVFSSDMKERAIKFSYGDWNFPQAIFKEEEALITSLTSRIDVGSQCISYNLKAISTGLKLSASKFNFPETTTQASTLIYDLCTKQKYGVQDSFPGMTKKLIAEKNLIPNNDCIVTIEPALQCSVIDRINQCVNSMVCADDPTAGYGVVFHSEKTVENPYPYIEVREYAKFSSMYDYTYEIDIGYPGENYVTGFDINNNIQWSILYETSADANINNYQQRIDGFGKLITLNAPSVTAGNELKSTVEDLNWWKQVTEYPIQASVQLKGLILPSLLMDTIKVNILFFGRKHIASGVYNITKQVDSIDSNGYKTTLSLLRTAGENIL